MEKLQVDTRALNKQKPAIPKEWEYLSSKVATREGNGNPLQYSCLENPTDRRAWRATVHGVAKSRTRLSDEHTHSHHGKIRGMPNSKPEDHRAYYQIGTAYARGKEDLTGTTPEESRHSTSQSC